MRKDLEGRGSWNCSSQRRPRRPSHKEQGRGHEVTQTLEMPQHFWESGLALTCPVGGMGRAGLRGDNGGDVSGSSGAAHGKTGRAETGQHTTTGNAKGYSMCVLRDCRDTGNKSRDGRGAAPGVLQPFHETRAIPSHHPPRSGGALPPAPLDAAVDRTVCVLSMFWLDLECRKRCWKPPGWGQWGRLEVGREEAAAGGWEEGHGTKGNVEENRVEDLGKAGERHMRHEDNREGSEIPQGIVWQFHVWQGKVSAGPDNAGNAPGTSWNRVYVVDLTPTRDLPGGFRCLGNNRLQAVTIP